MVRVDQPGAADLQPQGAKGIWQLTGRRILSWRNWDGVGAGTYDGGEAKGIWQCDQHRLVFSLNPPPPLLLHIDRGPTRDSTLPERAGIACLSPCHFSRSFKKAYGSGPQRYTVHCRVEHANALLRHNANSLAGIAAALGFADQSHSTAAFRREAGMTPGRFRLNRKSAIRNRKPLQGRTPRVC